MGGRSMDFKVAYALYSARDEAEKDLRSVLEKIKELGYDGVEFAGLYDYEPKEIKAMLDEVGLVPISAHVPLTPMVEDPHAVIGDYKEIGCPYIAIPYLEDERRPGTDGFDATLKDIEEVSKVSKEYGIQMLYHNHDFEFVKVDGKYGLDIIFDTVSDDLLKTEIDTCWVNVAGLDPAEYVRQYSGRSPVVHLKDFVMKGKEKPEKLYELIGMESESKDEAEEEVFGFRSLGDGIQDFKSILEASKDAGADWVVVEQDMPSPGRTPLEDAKRSRDHLRDLGIK